MAKRLFLLDGMALVYRAHFALIARPILSSKGVNTSALFGFTQTLLEIQNKQKPTHLAVAFDTEAPTARHVAYPEYKATRQTMPEDLAAALPHVRRMLEAFRVPLLICDGFEADDIIGTLARRAEKEGFQTSMVTPDKDFGQLVDANTVLYKPARMGDAVEVMGVPEICARWGIQRPEQVVDVLALMGDSSDNVPGVPGIGEKTAIKLIAEFGSVENLLARTGELKGRTRETLEKNRDLALLSKQLVTISCDAPCPVDLDSLRVQPADDEKLRSLLIEFEFNSIGRRLFGEDLKAGRGFQAPAATDTVEAVATEMAEPVAADEGSAAAPVESKRPAAELKNLTGVSHQYEIVSTAEGRAKLRRSLAAAKNLSFAVEATTGDPKDARLAGLAFSLEPHHGYYVPLPDNSEKATAMLEEFRPVLESNAIEKTGHDLKNASSVLAWRGISLRGKIFDATIAHSLVEPEMRHALAYLSEVYLGYAVAQTGAEGAGEQLSLGDVASEKDCGTRDGTRGCGAAIASGARTAVETEGAGARFLRGGIAACSGAGGHGIRGHPD